MKIAYAKALREVVGKPYPYGTVLPPNRLETSSVDFGAALCAMPGENALRSLEEELRALTGRQHIVLAPSCRSAIALIVKLLPQREVVMPAYTCPVVKTAVEIAGKQIIYVDIDSKSLNATSTQFADHARPGRILLPTHLFGIPTDIENICKLASERQCVTIEDAAAAAVAMHGGRLLGTFADFGIISFERSKRFPAFRGAAIIVNNEELIEYDRLSGASLARTSRKFPVGDLLFAMAYNMATLPWVYGWMTLPGLLRRYAAGGPTEEISRRSEAQTPFYTREFHPFQAALVLRMLTRREQIGERVARLVATYLDVLQDSHVTTYASREIDCAALLRFPIAVPGKRRAEILRLGLKRGLFLETNYEGPLPPRGTYRQFPNAVWAAENLVLLPLYTALSPGQARHIAEEVLEIAFEGPTGMARDPGFSLSTGQS